MTLRNRSYLGEADQKFKVDGKSGVWRTVADNPVFFPDDGSKPVGIPKALKGEPKDLDEPKEISGKMKQMRDSSGRFIKKNKGAGAKGVNETLKKGGKAAQQGADDLEQGKSTPEGKSFLNKAIGNAIKAGIGGALLMAFPAVIGYGLMFMMAAGVAKSMKGKLAGAFEAKEDFKKKLGQDIEASIQDVFKDVAAGKIDGKEWKAALAKAKKHTGKG